MGPFYENKNSYEQATLDGEPPLCVAVRYERPMIIETLLQLDYENRKTPESILKRKNRRDETPLFIAVENSNVELVDTLIRAGASPVEPCIRGWTALHEACVQGNVSILVKLLMCGCNLDTADCYGCTPLFTAAMQGKEECAELLCQRGANTNEKTLGNPATPLHEAASRGNFRLCEILLEYKADPNLLNARNNAPIHLAAFGDHVECVALLSERTSKRKIQNFAGKSPLISCLEEDNCNYDSMEVLLKAGWDPNHCLSEKRLQYKDHRKTALFFAVINNDEDCAELLLQYGAKVDIDPLRPLTVAVSWSNFEMFDLLRSYGANIHDQTDEIGIYPQIVSGHLGCPIRNLLPQNMEIYIQPILSCNWRLSFLYQAVQFGLVSGTVV